MSEGVVAPGLSPASPRESPAPSPPSPGPRADRLGVWRPVLLRIGLGALALLGLSAIGTLSMLAGVEGARANPSATPAALTAEASVPATSPTAEAHPPASSSASPAASSSASPVAACSGRLADGRVVLNRATLDELRQIPGVGPKRASAILALRERLGRFKKPADLVRIRGIGQKTLKRMQAAFVIDEPGCTDPAKSPEQKPK